MEKRRFSSWLNVFEEEKLLFSSDNDNDNENILTNIKETPCHDNNKRVKSSIDVTPIPTTAAVTSAYTTSTIPSIKLKCNSNDKNYQFNDKFAVHTTNIVTASSIDRRTCDTKHHGRWGHILFDCSDYLYIYGGQTDNGITIGHISTLKIDHHSSSYIVSHPFISEDFPRSWHSGQYLSDKKLLVVYGGHKIYTAETSDTNASDDQVTYMDDVLVFDTTIELWYPPCVSGKTPTARSGHSSGIVLNKLIVIYGGDKHDKYHHNINVLDTERWHWNQPKCEGKPPKARSYHTCTNINSNTLLYFGGSDSNACFNCVHLLISNDKGTGWRWEQPEISGDKPYGRTKHSAIMLTSNRYILIRGGIDSDEVIVNDSYLLDTVEWKWISIDDSVVHECMSQLTQGAMASSLVSMKSSSNYKAGEQIVRVGLPNDSHDTALYIYGGMDSDGTISSALYSINEAKLLKMLSL